MAFNSFSYLIFLAISVALYYLMPRVAVQRLLLIIASLVFVGWFNWLSLVVLVLMVGLNYTLLQRLGRAEGRRRKSLYYVGISFTAAALLIYKVLQEILVIAGVFPSQGFDSGQWIVLGIGFYSLQLIGYYIEVYQRRAVFNLDIFQFFTATAFFGKLSSGPIFTFQQSGNLVPALPIKFEESNFAFGVHRILLGMFKKVALADRLFPYVQDVFDQHSYINGLMIYLGPFLFTMQLYFDFSGYIDIAIGSGRLFGIKLPENFNLPLRATSISQYWRRWHITLVNWLTQYVFYPVSFRFRKLHSKGLAIAVVCTFLVSAAWHGLAITFFVYALFHFTFIVLENIGRRTYTESNFKGIKRALTLIWTWHLIALGNMFFRVNNLSDVGQFVRDFITLPFLYKDGSSFSNWLVNGGQDIEVEFNLRLTVLLGVIFLILERKINQYAFSERYQVGFVALMLVLVAVFGMFDSGERFIYLQFS